MSRSGDEPVASVAHGLAHAVHGGSHFVRRVARHILTKGGAIDLAPRSPASPGKPFGFLEDLVWNGDGRLHTESITEDNPSPDTGGPTATDRAKLSREEFFKILIAELGNQDPLQPMDNQELLGQMANLQNLEASASLTDAVSGMARFQEMSAAASLIGREVHGRDGEGAPASGVVERVRADQDGVLLVLEDGTELRFGSVTEVAAAPAAAA